MAMTSAPRFHRLARFGLTTANAPILAAFYIQAFGFRQMADTRLRGQTFRRLMGVESDARCITVMLGSSIIELVQFDVPGAPYPSHATASAPVFQHFAIVAVDMAAAWPALQEVRGWTPITVGEPQRLPKSSGGVTAFKFRDPEGHPLELLSFPPDNAPPPWQIWQHGRACLGIDHSAISVCDTQTSLAFYKAHGLVLSARSQNSGPEQDKLDGLDHAIVAVTGLTPAIATPHVELLCYREKAPAPLSAKSNDVAATRLIFESSEATESSLFADPDGHHVMAVPPNQESSPA
jgi:catechol 2,3-dioxygenase-like lactoylglutathione lyase family enzyme